jgi:hypothetical protein
MIEERAYQATPEEIEAGRRKCWTPSCKRRAWLEGWDGWRWCFRCWIYNLRWSGGNTGSKWLDIRTVKLYWPKKPKEPSE